MMTEIENLEARIHNLEIALMALAKPTLELIPAAWANNVNDVFIEFDVASAEFGATMIDELKRKI